MSKAFNKLLDKDGSTLLIVDSLNLAFRWKHQKKYTFADEYRNTVNSLARSYSAGKIIIAADSGKSAYRRALYSEYKMNREEKRQEQTPEEQMEFELFFQEYLKVLAEYVEADEYPVIKLDKTEADDIAAYIVKYKSRYKISNIVLASSDRDWDLLVSNDTMRFSYVTRKEITLENWNEHYDCTPDQYISIKCLQGDSGDNVPGVPGIGPAKALALVKQYGSALDVALELPITSKYKHIQNLNAFGSDALLLNYKLMDLLEFCDEALGPAGCAEVDTVMKRYFNATKY